MLTLRERLERLSMVEIQLRQTYTSVFWWRTICYEICDAFAQNQCQFSVSSFIPFDANPPLHWASLPKSEKIFRRSCSQCKALDPSSLDERNRSFAMPRVSDARWSMSMCLYTTVFADFIVSDLLRISKRTASPDWQDAWNISRHRCRKCLNLVGQEGSL